MFDPPPNGSNGASRSNGTNGQTNGGQPPIVRPPQVVEQPPAEAEKVSQVATRQAKRLFLLLLAAGLALGLLTSIGVVAALKQFGLTEVVTPAEKQ